MIGSNASRVVGFGVNRTGLGETTERLYAHGATPSLDRIEGALEEVVTCVKLGLIRSAEVQRLRSVQESMAPLVDECERKMNGWGG